ncbi:MAG: metallophosphoesterase [Saprospiraceae bacterium]
MKITINNTLPYAYFPYLNISTRHPSNGGMRTLLERQLPIYLGTLKSAAVKNLDYLVIASDLQGNIEEDGWYRLMGEVLPDFLQTLFAEQLGVADCQRVGVLLCGDMYATIEKRGGLGDVRPVWRAFNRVFKFVAGVAGNHDSFGGNKTDLFAFNREEGIHFLDRQMVELDGLKIGGLSGIIGNPRKQFRYEEEQHMADLKRLLTKRPDIVLLHEGPNGDEPNERGNELIRATLATSSSTTVCFGHTFWHRLAAEMSNGTQLINLDEKCLLLKIEKE